MRYRVLTQEELNRYIDEAEPLDVRVLLILMAKHGVSFEQILSLKWSNLSKGSPDYLPGLALDEYDRKAIDELAKRDNIDSDLKMQNTVFKKAGWGIRAWLRPYGLVPASLAKTYASLKRPA